MDPTLTFQLPFTLLGRNDVLDPKTHWSCSQSPPGPIQIVHSTLRKFCPNIPILLASSHTNTTNDTCWTLLPHAHNSTENNPQSHLSPDESAHLGRNVWTCHMVLQRSGIPHSTSTDTWTHFKREAREIFNILTTAFNTAYTEIGSRKKKGRMWSLLTVQNDLIRVSLAPPNPSKKGDKPERLDNDVVHKILVVFAAIEKEFVRLGSPAVCLEYWLLSRFLEYKAVRRLGEEKAAMWKRLGARTNLAGEKKGEMYVREKEKWWAGFEDEDGDCRGGKRREWWNVLDDMDGDELLRDVWAFGGSGRRLVVEPEFDKGEITNHPTTSSNLFHPGVTGLALPPHRSTTDIEHILAYLELLTNIIHLPLTNSHANLLLWLEQYREITLRNPEKPLCGLDWILRSLGLGRGMSFWEEWLRGVVATETVDGMQREPRDLHYDPFRPLREHVDNTLAEDRTYTATFVERYDEAGGFWPTKKTNLYELLMADEQRRKEKVQRNGPR